MFLENENKALRIGAYIGIFDDDLLDMLDAIDDEIEKHKEDILQVCYQSMPVGSEVKLHVRVDYYGEWQITICLKLTSHVVNVGVEDHVEYSFDVNHIGRPNYFTLGT